MLQPQFAVDSSQMDGKFTLFWAAPTLAAPLALAVCLSTTQACHKQTKTYKLRQHPDTTNTQLH